VLIIIIIIKDLWDYVSQLDIRINHTTHVSYEQIIIKTCSAQYFKGPALDVIKDESSIAYDKTKTFFT